MNNQEIRVKARELLKPYCRVCPECNGVACRGEVPGMGGKGTGRAFIKNYDAIKRIELNMKVVHGVKTVDTSCTLFGETLALPVFAAPMTGIKNNMGGAISEAEYLSALIEGCSLGGILPSVGDGGSMEQLDKDLATMNELKRKSLLFIKPWLNEDWIRLMDKADPSLVVGIGSDLDGCGLTFLNHAEKGVYPKTQEQIKELVQATNIPFIIKGVMTVEDAMACYEVGASAIVVSNHGGRVLDCARATADVLPLIAEKLKGKLTILVDGGIRDGVDVFKMLALGADGVLIGRPFATYAFGGGSEGVALYVEKLKSELTGAMLLTGAATIKDITPDKVHLV